jgi:hypothetical protein
MTGNVNSICSDGNDGWLRNCVNAVPNFKSDCLGSATMVDSPLGSQLPPKDMAYPSAKVRYISIATDS